MLHKGLTNKVLPRPSATANSEQLYVHIAFNKVLLHFYAAFNAVKWCWYIFTEKLGILENAIFICKFAYKISVTFHTKKRLTYPSRLQHMQKK